MNTELKDLICTVKTASPQEVKQAQKAIEHYWRVTDKELRKKAFEIFLEEITEFDGIEDVNHQAYFVSSLKWAFWALGEEYYEHWVDFVLKAIQHPSGKVRQQVFHSADILSISLKLEPYSFDKEPTSYDDIRFFTNLIKFGLYAYSVERLCIKYHEPKFNRYKYVSSLPVGIYKSLQILTTQAILRSEFYIKKYEDFFYQFQGVTDSIYTGEYSKDLKMLLQTVQNSEINTIN